MCAGPPVHYIKAEGALKRNYSAGNLLDFSCTEWDLKICMHTFIYLYMETSGWPNSALIHRLELLFSVMVYLWIYARKSYISAPWGMCQKRKCLFQDVWNEIFKLHCKFSLKHQMLHCQYWHLNFAILITKLLQGMDSFQYKAVYDLKFFEAYINCFPLFQNQSFTRA